MPFATPTVERVRRGGQHHTVVTITQTGANIDADDTVTITDVPVVGRLQRVFASVAAVTATTPRIEIHQDTGQAQKDRVYRASSALAVATPLDETGGTFFAPAEELVVSIDYSGGGDVQLNEIQLIISDGARQ